MGTWIEISRSLLHIVIDRVVPYVGTWIEISKGGKQNNQFCCRSLRGNVDRNTVACVLPLQHLQVVPYVGTWIEMFQPILRE